MDNDTRKAIKASLEDIRAYKNTEAVDYLETAVECLQDLVKPRLAKPRLSATVGHLEQARGSLLGALAHSTPVEALLIENLITGLMQTLNDTNRLLTAMDT